MPSIWHSHPWRFDLQIKPEKMTKIPFFQTLETVLFATDPQDKISKFSDFYEHFLSHRIFFEDPYIPKIQNIPSYASFCKILHPTRISRPKLPTSIVALAKIIHSIAHIEYSAIVLALDASYRFGNMSREYYADWLEVANEEIRHFNLLHSALGNLGYQYGDFAVHQNLFNAMRATDHSLSHRMGLVHRALEATGLDANPFVVQKLQQHKDNGGLLEILEIILRDEINHVGKGDKWWKLTKNDNESFFEILKTYSQFSPSGRTLNIQARIQAGYNPDELEKMQNLQKSSIL